MFLLLRPYFLDPFLTYGARGMGVALWIGWEFRVTCRSGIRSKGRGERRSTHRVPPAGRGEGNAFSDRAWWADVPTGEERVV